MSEAARGAGVALCSLIVLALAVLSACSGRHSVERQVAPHDLGDIVGQDFVGTAAETLNGRIRTSPARFQFNYLDVYGSEPLVDIAGVWYSDSLGFGTIDGWDPSAQGSINLYATWFILNMFHNAACGATYLHGEGTFDSGYRTFVGTYRGEYCGDTLRASFSTRR